VLNLECILGTYARAVKDASGLTLTLGPHLPRQPSPGAVVLLVPHP